MQQRQQQQQQQQSRGERGDHPAGPRAATTILVTGGCGFIGSHTVEHLLSSEPGVRVRILDNLSTGSLDNLAGFRGRFEEGGRLEVVVGDITDHETCERACAGCDAVLHLAAVGSVPRSIREPLRTHSNNVDGFVKLIVAAQQAGARRFVYASSSSVYGTDDLPQKTEASLGEALSPYAVSKRFDELYANVCARVYGMECVGLRYFNVFGPRQNPEGAYAAVIPRWIAGLRRGEAPVIFGDGSNARDFTFVSNVAEANALALLGASAGDIGPHGAVLNVGAGGRTDLSTLARLLCEMTGREDLTPTHTDPRPGDIAFSQADISEARRVLGYRPDVGVVDGLRRTVRAMCTSAAKGGGAEHESSS